MTVLAGAGRAVELTPAQLDRLAGQLGKLSSAAGGNHTFYSSMTLIIPVLLAPVLQELYAGSRGRGRGAHTRRKQQRSYMLALVTLSGLACIVLSSMWSDRPLRPDWRAAIVWAELLALSGIVASRMFTVARSVNRAASAAPAGGGFVKHASRRARPLVAQSVGRVGLACILVGAGLFLLLDPSSQARSRSYQVYGTCAAGACGLNERLQPSSRSEPRGQLRDGARVGIVCQVVGERQTNRNGEHTDVWDKLDTGVFVTDLYVDTPQIGSGIPSCPTRPPGSAAAR